MFLRCFESCPLFCLGSSSLFVGVLNIASWINFSSSPFFSIAFRCCWESFLCLPGFGVLRSLFVVCGEGMYHVGYYLEIKKMEKEQLKHQNRKNLARSPLRFDQQHKRLEFAEVLVLE